MYIHIIYQSIGHRSRSQGYLSPSLQDQLSTRTSETQCWIQPIDMGISHDFTNEKDTRSSYLIWDNMGIYYWSPNIFP